MKEQIVNLIAEQFGLDEVYENDDLIQDLKGDALDIIELVMTLEEEFNIEISDSEADRIQTVEDVYNCVLSKSL